MSREHEVHTVLYLQLPGGKLVRAAEGELLDVTINRRKIQAAVAADPLLRDVGRPGWPHKAT